jgi:hypothetical protein
MLIPILFFLLFSCTSIARKAKARGLKPISWILATVLSFFMGIFVASTLLSLVMLYKNPAVYPLIQSQDRARFNAFLMQNISDNLLLYSLLIFTGAMGGYLLVRFVLEKKK